MKLSMDRKCERGLLVIFLLLAPIFASALAFSQEPDKVKAELFREIDAKMQQARQEEVPTFAPTLFAKARDFYNRAEQNYKRGERLEKIREELQQAMQALNKAFETTKVSKVALAEAVDTRKKAAQLEYNKLAPQEFAQAERDYQEAIRRAETGDIRAARERAEQAMRGYRGMTIIALERGPLKEAIARLEDLKRTLPHEKYTQAVRDLEALKDTVRKAKGQKFDIAALVADVLAGKERIFSAVSKQPLTGKGLPDLILLQGVWVRDQPIRWDEIIVETIVKNQGTKNVDSVNVRISDSEKEIRTVKLASLPAGGIGHVAVSWKPSKLGTHLIKAVVDPDRLIDESDERNNLAEIEVQIERCGTRRDCYKVDCP
jgi:tetratricopeptide (TPR) repeat protein